MENAAINSTFEADPNWWKINYETQDYSKSHQSRSSVEIANEIGFITNILPENKDSLWVDLACAAGKHLHQLEKLGFSNLVGIDISQLMISTAQNISQKSRIKFIHGDMRTINGLKPSPKIISIFYNSIGFFSSDSANFDLFNLIYESLGDNGYFYFDFFPAPFLLANIRKYEESSSKQEKIIVRERYDNNTKRLIRNTKIVSCQHISERTSSQRIFQIEEIRQLLNTMGFADIQLFGDYKKERYSHLKHNKACVLAMKY